MIEIHNLSGEVIFRSETAETMLQAVVEAVAKGQSLARANLGGAYLGGAYLGGANLPRANLGGANLAGAYLTGANLDGAYLARAYLPRANLDGAYLAGAYLARANLDGAYLARANLDGANLDGAKMPIHCAWDVTHTGEVIHIGCKSKTIPEWDAWFASEDTFETDRGTAKFQQIHANYLAIRAYLTHLGSVK